jgi:PIN domain nuclease of toxin-antitoxin system
VVVWTLEGSRRLGRRTQRAIEREARRSAVLVSAISFWEITMLVQHGRLRLETSFDEYREQALRGIQEQPVDGAIAILAARLDALHGDPADRMIVATALQRGATLVTADEALLEIERGPELLDARR